MRHPTTPRPLTAPLGGVPILTAAALWGTTGTAASLAPAGAPAAAVGSAGLALGGPLLLLTARGTRTLIRTSTRRERWLLALGALAVAGYPIGFYPAVARTGVAVTTVIALGSAPVLTGLLACLTRRARPTARWVSATLLAVIGCALLVLGPRLTGGGAPVDAAGAALAGLAGLSYAGYTLIGARLIAGGHPSGAVLGTMFGGAAPLVLPVALSGGVQWLTAPRGAAVAAYLALCTTFLAYRLFGHGLRHATAHVATTLTLAEPAVAAVLGVAVMDERLPAVSWCGLAALAGSLVFLTVPPAARRRRPRGLRHGGASTTTP
ncbi:EamA family transporter [Streptomyces sp. RFCAC02]|uniref:DMT family transporter n=1 Tax=Streptomyces sp. RFCAC02 TaxID=2499143 RepID=UPI0010217265|nr:EamA family transporter [Streptomyces sp. RFCAC02]